MTTPDQLIALYTATREEFRLLVAQHDFPVQVSETPPEFRMSSLWHTDAYIRLGKARSRLNTFASSRSGGRRPTTSTNVARPMRFRGPNTWTGCGFLATRSTTSRGGS